MSEKDLRNWKLLEQFQRALGRAASQSALHRTWSDPRRDFDYRSYLSLFLFGLFNPVIQSMRGLCAISALTRVQKEICRRRVSLGAFSEMQSVLDPALLQRVFADLVAQSKALGQPDTRLAHLELIAQDATLWRALPRMAWAEYGVGRKGEARGVRLHLRFHLLQDKPVDAQVSNGKFCERKALRQMCLPGQTTVGDRYHGEDYRLFAEIGQAKGFFVFRVKETAVVHMEEPLPLGAAEESAGVVRHGWVHLGATEKLRSMRVRLVEIRQGQQHLLLVTNLSVEVASAELIGAIYRRRWSIELFFRWIKCILGCRHFFAESPQGVTIQIYLLLIAAVIFQDCTGRRPSRRMMELLQFYLAGWASAEELVPLLEKHLAKANKKSR